MGQPRFRSTFPFTHRPDPMLFALESSLWRVLQVRANARYWRQFCIFSFQYSVLAYMVYGEITHYTQSTITSVVSLGAPKVSTCGRTQTTIAPCESRSYPLFAY